MLDYKNETINKWRSKRLCAKEATLSEIWAAVESLHTSRITTFKTLSDEFQTTIIWKKLTLLTQKNYIRCHEMITRKTTNEERLGDIPISDWTTGLVRRYRDKRGEQSESRTNKELSYIKRIFSWAYEYEKVTKNPATGVKKINIEARQHYAEDKDYNFMLEIAYLCRMRLSEVLDLSDANELDNGLLIIRRKGSKTNITEMDTQAARRSTTHNNLCSKTASSLPLRSRASSILWFKSFYKFNF